MSTDRDTTQASWELPDALWYRMEPLIPPKKGQTGHPRSVDLRRITEGIFYVLRTGIHWPACPRERFGPPSTVYDDLAPWVKAGGFALRWAAAVAVYDARKGREWTWQSVDGAMTKAPVGGRPRAPSPRPVASAGPSAVS
jgi:putative transposase